MFTTRGKLLIALCGGGATLVVNHEIQKHSQREEIYQKYPSIVNLDMYKKRVQKLAHFDEKQLPQRMQSVPFEIDWLPSTQVKLQKTTENHEPVNRHYFVGGLEALFSCLRFLENSQDGECIYVNDGKPLIANRAGMQLHEHPTQYPDYDLFHLFKKVLESIHVVPRENPLKWNYSCLHLSFSAVFKDPIGFVKTYVGCFVNKLWHIVTSENYVSSDDQDLVNIIRGSIQNLKKIDEDIRRVTGKSIMNQNGRLYWSIDKKLIQQKEAIWKHMGIDCEMIPREEINAMTLLDATSHEIYALRMKKDGEIHPDILPTTIEYMQKKFPKRFTFRTAKLVEVNRNDKTGQVVSVVEESPDGKRETIEVDTLYASLGHNDIFENKRRKYHLISVSGVTSDWKVKIPKSLLLQRVQPKLNQMGITLEEYVERDYLVPSADMFNLHVKVLDHQFSDDSVILYIRATAGANMMSEVAEKSDLINIAYKLNSFFVGEWELLAAGSCTRKTGIRNRPEIEENFRYGQSGIGISVSAGEYSKESFTRK